jgi:hypothetical protein
VATKSKKERAIWWWWQWREVRRAAIDHKLREQFELFGEDVLAHGLAAGVLSQKSEPLDTLLKHNHREIVLWLQERRDIAERHENRIETVEKWILVFVAVGVVVESVNLFRSFAH